MYSGTTFRTKSGRIIGTHQKFDRSARIMLKHMIPHKRYFPSSLDILHFEGKNGPDGIKSKSPSRDEPWHYIDPSNPSDTELLTHIDNHFHNLTVALATDNHTRAAFEAAWLAHAITDGLTPAHHYPLSDKIEELWGHPKEERTTIKTKNIISAATHRERLSKNWEYWGAKGVFMTHILFEFGVASTVSTTSFTKMLPSANSMVRVKREGFDVIFMEAVHKVYAEQMYELFYKKGWNRTLARKTRKLLAPTIIQTIALAWYAASEKSAVMRKGRS